MDLKESCTAEERVVAVVGDWGWFYRVNEVAEHPPMGPNKNCVMPKAVGVSSVMIWFTVAATGRWIGFSG